MPQVARFIGWSGLLLLLGGCSLFGAKDNADPPAELVDFKPTLEVETLWHAGVAGSDGRYLALRPLYHQGRLFLADHKGRVVALDPASGKTLWRVDTGLPLSGGPGAAGELLLLGTEEAELVALTQEKGEQRWRRRVSSEVLSSPAGEAGVAVVRSADGRVIGVNSSNGETRWFFDRSVPVLTLRGNSSPLVRDGRVFIGFANGKLACLELDSGTQVWETPIATPRGRTELERVVDIDADPVLVEEVIYSASFHGGVAAVSEASGVVLWKRKLSSHAGLDADWRQVYLSDNQDHIWSLDANNGASLWQQKMLHARGISAPAIVGDYLVVGDRQGYLHWFAQEDGHLVARTHVSGEPIRIKPLVVDGVVYVFDDGGRLTALRPKLPKPPKPE